MDDAKAARDKLQRIRQLWLELERTEENSPEYEVRVQKIHALSAEYISQTESAAKRERSGGNVRNTTAESKR
jgi:hypothetical protein